MLTDFILSNLLGIVSLCCIIGLFLWVNSKITVYTDTLNNLHNDENKRLSALETFLQRGILLDTQDKIAYNQDNKDNNGTESLNVNVNSMPLKIKLKSKSK